MKELITKEELMSIVKDLAALSKEALSWIGYLTDRHCACCHEEWPLKPRPKHYTENLSSEYIEKHKIDCPYARAKILIRRLGK